MNFSQSEIVTWRRRSCICEVPQVDTNDKEWLSSSGTFAIHSTWSRNQRKQWKCHIDGFGFPPRFEDAIFQFEHCIHPPDRDAKPRENTGVPAQMKPPHNNCWSWFMNIYTHIQYNNSQNPDITHIHTVYLQHHWWGNFHIIKNVLQWDSY